MRRLVGVLGGMGPLATADLLAKIVGAGERLLDARIDQDHVPVIAWSVPQVPDRKAALATGSDAPVAAMVEGIGVLARAGAGCVAIACNTAHVWFEALQGASPVPILHIADACVAALERQPARPRRVALLSTEGTRRAGFYQERLARAGIEVVLPGEEEAAQLGSAIDAVKAGALDVARRHAGPVGERLLASGASALVLACTELPLALDASPLRAVCIDATVALAEAATLWSAGRGPDPRSWRG
jgi:aspartate racemase